MIEHPRSYIRAEEFFGPDHHRLLPITGQDRRGIKQEGTGSERQAERG
jgi:hypothetical protein